MVWSRCQRVVKSEQFGIWLARRRVLEVRMTTPMMILELFWRNEWLWRYMSIYLKGHVTRSKDKDIRYILRKVTSGATLICIYMEED